MPRKRKNKKTVKMPFSIRESIVLFSLPILTIMLSNIVKIVASFELSNYRWVSDILSILTILLLAYIFLKFEFLKLETKLSQIMKIFFIYTFAVIFGSFGSLYPPDFSGTFAMFFILQYFLLCIDVLSKKFDKLVRPRKRFKKKRRRRKRGKKS